MTPPSYPRVAHLVAGRGSRNDLVLSDTEVAALLGAEAVVEEKLDGANVMLWRDPAGRVQCSLRAGPGAMDRAGQLGPLRAWAAAHDEPLQALLDPWPVLYGEWLLLTHTVAYDRLPTYLVVLDLWRDGDGFAGVDQRDSVCGAVGLVTPPQVWRGVPGSLDRVEVLLGTSAWASSPAEGLVLRRTGEVGAPRLAKLVGAAWVQLDDEGWRAGRPRNRLAAGEASWR
ncbi:MAG: RNA ligase family protein [Acidimicrobiales bacterium]